MTVSVRMERLLEKRLEMAAKQKGVTKSQFIIDAVERALGGKNPYELLLQVKAEEASGKFGPVPAPADSREIPYEADGARAFIQRKLKAKHGVGDLG